jgi:hypothetical protein
LIEKFICFFFFRVTAEISENHGKVELKAVLGELFNNARE